MTDEELYILMTIIPGLGPVTQNKLLNIFGGIRKCFEMTSELENIVTPKQAKQLKMHGRAINAFFTHKNDPELVKRAAEIADSCFKEGIKPITRENGAYPERFNNLLDVPILLYAKGTFCINDFPRSIGVVGSRRCTREGKERAIVLAEREALAGTAIISGMAKGIDSYAHTACIKKNGYTIAVLGNGPDICYPKEHQSLYDAIVKTGCVISEYPPGTEPRPYNFPLRNRIIAALSDELFVAEAGSKSGTTSTVIYDKQYNSLRR